MNSDPLKLRPVATRPNATPGLLRQIREDFCCHARDWTLPGFRTIAIHRFGVWRMKLRPRLVRWPFSLLYRILFLRCRNVYGIELLYTVAVGRRVVIEHQGGIIIHQQSVIGDDCIIRQGVTLGIKSTKQRLGAPVLGRGVEVGAGAVILGDVIVGDWATIGANAVVTKDVSAGTTVAGVPAVPIHANGEAAIPESPKS